MDTFIKFLLANNLKKGEIASYLGVSKAFVTQLASGERRLPADKLALITANSDWDTSMFTSTLVDGYGQRPVQKTAPKIKFVVGAEAEDAREREGYIKRLLEEIKELKAQRDALMQEVAVLKYQLEQK